MFFYVLQKDVMPKKTTETQDNQKFPANLPTFKPNISLENQSASAVKATPKNSITGKGKTIKPKASTSKKGVSPSATVISSDSESQLCDLTQDTTTYVDETTEDYRKTKRQSAAAKRKAGEQQLVSVMTAAFERKNQTDSKAKGDEPIDEFTIYGDHVAAEIRALPDKRSQSVMKHAINSAIYDVQMSLFKQTKTAPKPAQTSSPVSVNKQSGKGKQKRSSSSESPPICTRIKKSLLQFEPDPKYGYEGPNPYLGQKTKKNKDTFQPAVKKVQEPLMDTTESDDITLDSVPSSKRKGVKKVELSKMDTTENDNITLDSVPSSKRKGYMKLRSKSPTCYFLG